MLFEQIAIENTRFCYRINNRLYQNCTMFYMVKMESVLLLYCLVRLISVDHGGLVATYLSPNVLWVFCAFLGFVLVAVLGGVAKYYLPSF